jgi:hypothetical protein
LTPQKSQIPGRHLRRQEIAVDVSISPAEHALLPVGRISDAFLASKTERGDGQLKTFAGPCSPVGGSHGGKKQERKVREQLGAGEGGAFFLRNDHL